MKRVALLASFLALFVAACGDIGVQAQTISLAYKVGQTYKYTLHITLKYTVGLQGLSLPFNVDMSGKEQVKVKSVDSSGTAVLTIDLTDLSVKTTVNGTTNTTTTTNTTSIEMKVASDGRVISVNGSALGSTSSLPGMSGAEGGLVTAILPDKPVKRGDKWTKNYDQTNPMNGTGAYHVTSDNTYLKDEQVGGVNTAEVESKINSDIDLTFDISTLSGQGGTSLFPTTGGSPTLKSMTMKGTTKSDVTTWIDNSAHRIVKSHSTGSVDATLTLNTATPGATMPGLSGPITLKGTQALEMNPV